MAREVHAEDYQCDNDIENKTQRELVIKDRAQAVEFEQKPINEETIRYDQAKYGDEKEPHSRFR